MWGDSASLAAWDAENLQSVTGMEISTKILKPAVDAATVNMGSKWRMPTMEDCVELIENTNLEITVIDGVKGGKFISKADTSKYIFLPFAGYAAEGSFTEQGAVVLFWSSSVSSDSLERVYIVGCQEDGYTDGALPRYFAVSVRGVC